MEPWENSISSVFFFNNFPLIRLPSSKANKLLTRKKTFTLIKEKARANGLLPSSALCPR